jgi:hypothetical protein
MMYFLQGLLELVTFVSSIYLIISGYSGNEKFTSIDYVRKRNLIFGIILLVLVLIVGLPDIYHGAIHGWEDASKIK